MVNILIHMKKILLYCFHIQVKYKQKLSRIIHQRQSFESLFRNMVICDKLWIRLSTYPDGGTFTEIHSKKKRWEKLPSSRQVQRSLMYILGAVHMSRASPANRADSILSRPMVA